MIPKPTGEPAYQRAHRNFVRCDNSQYPHLGPYLRWALCEAAIIAKRDHFKLARSVYY